MCGATQIQIRLNDPDYWIAQFKYEPDCPEFHGDLKMEKSKYSWQDFHDRLEWYGRQQ